MAKGKQSLMNTKGWHYDVTNRQIARATRILEGLNETLHNVCYEEQPDRLVLGKRIFYLCIPQKDKYKLPPSKWEKPGRVDIACFDSYGNLTIYASFLCTGGRQSGLGKIDEMNC